MSGMINPHTALVFVMVTMSAVDRTMDDEEITRIGSITRNLPIFADFNQEMLVPVTEQCAEILTQEGGLDAVIGLVLEALPDELHETAYALAVEVAAANLHVEQVELRFLQMLRDALDVDKMAVAAIEHSARVRHRTLPA